MMHSEDKLVLFGCLLPSVAVVIASVCAWITHVLVCIKTASWVLLVVGSVIVPIGVIHGIGVWFGYFPTGTP